MKKSLILFIILLMAVSFITGRYAFRSPSPATIGGDTITTVDTSHYVLPAPIADKMVGSETISFYIPVPSPVTVPDSGELNLDDSIEVQAVLTLSQKEYQSENYHLWISGIHPRLDSINVYERNNTIIPPSPKLRRWGIGVMAGYGMTRTGLSPTVSIGVTYRIW